MSGIGFLGAGVILKDGTSIRGLDTAATLWCAASVGAFAGAGRAAEATAVTVFVLAGNTLLRPLIDRVNRRPLTGRATEARDRVHATCARRSLADVRDLLEDVLARASDLARAIDVISQNEDDAEVEADLIPTNADPGELDRVVAELERSPLIRSATWTAGATS